MRKDMANFTAFTHTHTHKHILYNTHIHSYRDKDKIRDKMYQKEKQTYQQYLNNGQYHNSLSPF